jgi:SulP family sulfate permease
MPCLAGVLVMVSYNMSGWRTIASMCRKSVAGVTVLFVTLLLTVFFDLTLAIEVGLVFAIVIFMKRMTESTSISVIRDEMEVHHDGENGDECLTIPSGVEVYEIEGPFFFGIANKFDELTRMTPPVPIRVIRMRKVSFIDSTALHNLEIFIQSSQAEGREVILSGVRNKVDETLTKAGVKKMVGEQNVCHNIHLALERANELRKQMNIE